MARRTERQRSPEQNIGNDYGDLAKMSRSALPRLMVSGTAQKTDARHISPTVMVNNVIIGGMLMNTEDQVGRVRHLLVNGVRGMSHLAMSGIKPFDAIGRQS